MIPPLVERCPRCGYVGPPRQYRLVLDDVDGRRIVECPACQHRLKLLANPWLA